LAGISCGKEWLPLVLDPDQVLDSDPGLVPKLKPAESSSIGEVSSMSDEAAPEKDPDLDPVPGGGLSDEQWKDFNRVSLEMFPNISMENGLTIPQWWLLEWLRDQVKHDEVQMAYLMDVEEEARQLNKVAILLGAVEGFELMQLELMQVVIRAIGK
jgi:hypothetical protein